MKKPGWLAVVLFALGSFGCAPRSDWTDTLTLVNVTGRWEGTWEASLMANNAGNVARQIRLTLQQNGSKVKGKGDLSGPAGSGLSVDGDVSGEVFSGVIGRIRFELTVAGNEMTGPAEGTTQCPCRIKLHRVDVPE
jgi:hypothetical protein